jgi:hypothetical protein
MTYEMEALIDTGSQHELRVKCRGYAQLMKVEKDLVTNFCETTIKVKVKVKLYLEEATKTRKGSRRIARLFL